MSNTQQYCTFYLGGQYYGLDVLRVQEIVCHQKLTRVPLAHPVVQGLINLRGQIVTAIDLRKRLALPDRDPDSEVVNVVVHTNDGAVSLLVDEIGDVLDVDQEQFERSPETLQGEARDLILGTYKLSDRLLVVLDPDRIVSVPTVSS